MKRKRKEMTVNKIAETQILNDSLYCDNRG